MKKTRPIYASYILLLLFLSLKLDLSSQTRERRVVVSGEEIVLHHQVERTDQKCSDRAKVYVFFEGGIYGNQGYNSGRMLHGDYLRRQDGVVVEKGQFKKGLKTGKWRHWNQKGEVLRDESYEKGVLDGETIYYLSDEVREIRRYKKGLMHGKLKCYEESEEVRVDVYRYGKLKRSVDLSKQTQEDTETKKVYFKEKALERDSTDTRSNDPAEREFEKKESDRRKGKRKKRKASRKGDKEKQDSEFKTRVQFSSWGCIINGI